MTNIERTIDETSAETAFEPSETAADADAGGRTSQESESEPRRKDVVESRVEAGETEVTGSQALAPAQVEPTVFIPRITIGAFVREPNIRQVLSDAAADRRMLKVALDVRDGEPEDAVAHYRESPAPDLIIIESRLGRDGLFQMLEDLAQHCPAGTRLIVVGHENDVALYRQLLKFGVGDYLVAPIRPLPLIEAISQLFNESAGAGLGRVIAFFGTSGGAGSSTMAQNAAAAMADCCQASVLLVDLDLRFGTAALDFNLEPTQGVRDALEEGEALDETLIDRLVTTRDEHIGVLAASCHLDETPEYDPETIGHLIEKARATTSYILLDLPQSWSPANRRALFAADEIVLTATPDLAGLRNARNIVAVIRATRPNDPPPRLILNQVGLPKRREVSAADFERLLELQPAAQIPYDPVAFGAAAANGEPVAETRSNPAAAQAFEALALSFTGQKVSQAAKRGWAGWARRLMGGS